MSAVANESFAKTKLCKELGMSMSENEVGRVRISMAFMCKRVNNQKGW